MRAGSCGMSVLLIFTRVPDAIFYKDTEPFAQRVAIIYTGKIFTVVSHSYSIFVYESLFACVIWLTPALLIAVIYEILSRRRKRNIISCCCCVFVAVVVVYSDVVC